MKRLTLTTNNEEQTRHLGRQIGKLLRPSDTVCLFGDLGTGKTVLIKGIAEALEIPPDEITSASFVIISEHMGRLPLYHIDLYRVENQTELQELALEEYMDAEGITVIEWADRITDNGCTVSLTLKYINLHKRQITIEGPERFIEELTRLCSSTETSG